MVKRTKKLCSVENCSEKRNSRGLCTRHYQQHRKTVGFEPLPKDKPKTCEVQNCSKLSWARGLCGSHYQAWRREVKPKRQLPFRERHMDPDKSFQNRTEWQGECLVWTGYLQSDGYGQMRINGKGKRAHRYAWERIYGEIPQGMVIDHICHNRSCVNVDHLRLATRGQNSAHRKGPDSDSSSGHRNVYQHENGWQVKVKKNGKSYHIGLFDSKSEAIKAAYDARIELFGEFGENLN